MEKKENIGKAEIEERKPRLDWNKWDAIFFAILTPFVILAVFVILIPTGGLSYLTGLFNFPFDFIFVGLVVVDDIGQIMENFLFPFVVIGCSFVIIGSVRAFINWKRYTRKKRIVRITQIGIPILLITLYFLALFIPIELYSPRVKPFTYGFRDRIRIMADVGAIRNWLRTLNKKDCTGSYILLSSSSIPFMRNWPDSRRWPKSLKLFNPGSVILDLDENDNPKVRLEWGAALGHWGFEIGMEDMEIPASDFSRYGEYRLPLEPGAYIWYELQ
jgi:hypothetical protein